MENTGTSARPLRLSLVRYHKDPGPPEPRSAWTAAGQAINNSLALTAVARLSAAALVFVTSAYFLLSSFTFSWLNIINNENVLWIPKLIHSYTALYWTVFLLNAATLLPAFRRRTARWLTEFFLLILATVGMLLARVYWLYDLPLDPKNIAWSVAIALPLLYFGIHDLAMFSHAGLWRRQTALRNLPLRFVLACGGLAGVWYCLVALLRYPGLLTTGGPVLLVLLDSWLLHASIFVGFAAGLSCVAILMARRKVAVRGRWMISLAFFWIFASLLLRKLIAPALSFNNSWADLWAWAYPFPFVVLLAGWQVRRAALRQEALPARAEDALAEFIPRGRLWTAVAASVALGAAFLVPFSMARVDWNFLFQRMTAIAVWVLLFTVAWRLFARPAGASFSLARSAGFFLLAAACALGLAQSPRLWHTLGWKTVSQSAAAYNGTDASFQVAQLIPRPAIRDDDRTGLFPFLIKNSLIADPISPPAIKLARSLSATPGPKPNIYIIVVDCMRRDYVSAYNPRVTFTPHIAAFAREGFVFQHAYTNYGGTALSEPAIWAGAMIPSKHYVYPFSEMNALEQLTNVDGYQRLYTRDQILMRLLMPAATDTQLNVFHKQFFGLDLRDAVREINSQAPGSNSAPLFVYSQPQNLHPITLHEISRSGQKVSGSYPGFNDRYADELSKVDEAFGEFVDNLKARGEFDNSIVILTADHGEWLGEYGRWGHGQSLLPPVIEVPLIVHLPASLAQGHYVNTAQNVFLTDITPSLYYLLGHRDLRRNEFFGRPLFTQTEEEQKDYHQRYHLLMSSYAAVFAILDEDKQMLYVADAVDGNQSLYDIAEDHYGLDNLIDKASQRQFEELTRDSVRRLNAFYGYSSDPH
jgi:hypothetical protein